MNTPKPFDQIWRNLRKCLSWAYILVALVFLAGVFPMSVEAQARRGAGRAVSPRGRSSFGSGYGLRYDGGWGWGWRWVGNWVYPDVYVSPEVNDYVIWPPPAYIAPTTPRAGTTGRLVYDSSGKPIGVILRNSDGSKEFVPVST